MSFLLDYLCLCLCWIFIFFTLIICFRFARKLVNAYIDVMRLFIKRLNRKSERKEEKE